MNSRGRCSTGCPEVRIPTLVMHGELDSALGLERSQTSADNIPGAELVRISDAGHTLTMEAPDVVNEALAGFFRRVNR